MRTSAEREGLVGLWRLTKDIENPWPDRRQRHDWRSDIVWSAGGVFAVCPCYFDRLTLEVSRTDQYSTQCIRIMVDGSQFGKGRRGLRRAFEQFATLRKHWEPVDPETPNEAILEFERCELVSASARSVLDRLFAMGRITLDDVREAALADAPQNQFGFAPEELDSRGEPR